MTREEYLSKVAENEGRRLEIARLARAQAKLKDAVIIAERELIEARVKLLDGE